MKISQLTDSNTLLQSDKQNYFTNFNNMEKRYKDEILNIKSKLDEKESLLHTLTYDKLNKHACHLMH